MALIKPVKGIEPQFGKNCYLAENATIENLQIDYPSFEKGVENIVQLHQ